TPAASPGPGRCAGPPGERCARTASPRPRSPVHLVEEPLESHEHRVLAERDGHDVLHGRAVQLGRLAVGAGEAHLVRPRGVRGQATDDQVELATLHRVDELALPTESPGDLRPELLGEGGDEVGLASARMVVLEGHRTLRGRGADTEQLVVEHLLQRPVGIPRDGAARSEPDEDEQARQKATDAHTSDSRPCAGTAYRPTKRTQFAPAPIRTRSTCSSRPSGWTRSSWAWVDSSPTATTKAPSSVTLKP